MMNSLTQSYSSSSSASLAAPAPPVHSEMLRLRENAKEVGNVVDTLTARLETVLRAVPPGDQSAQARRPGESPLHEGLIDLNDMVDHQLDRLRNLIDRLTV